MTQTARAQALFTSTLQPSDHPTFAEVRRAIADSIRRYRGVDGCVAALAAEYGERPEFAAERMRWALGMAAAA